MHTVVEEQCTGCGLCLPPCPVDCIALTEPDGRSIVSGVPAVAA
jgi:electron transport complex protein RnfB